MSRNTLLVHVTLSNETKTPGRQNSHNLSRTCDLGNKDKIYRMSKAALVRGAFAIQCTLSVPPAISAVSATVIACSHYRTERTAPAPRATGPPAAVAPLETDWTLVVLPTSLVSL